MPSRTTNKNTAKNISARKTSVKTSSKTLVKKAPQKSSKTAVKKTIQKKPPNTLSTKRTSVSKKKSLHVQRVIPSFKTTDTENPDPLGLFVGLADGSIGKKKLHTETKQKNKKNALGFFRQLLLKKTSVSHSSAGSSANKNTLGRAAKKPSVITEPVVYTKNVLPTLHTHDSTHVIKVQNLYKKFGKKEAVRGVSFNITSGEIVGFLGPNGAGKTTVFYTIVGFLKPTKGNIMFDEKKINDLPMFKRAQKGIAYLPQETSVFRQLSVEQNILAVLQTISTMNRQQKKERLENLLFEFGLRDLRKQKAFTLSGGERRRTEIARGMAIDPYFLLLDEPFTGIDPKARYELKQIIASVARKNVGVLITDHNERDTLSITDRAFIMHQGKIVVMGSREEIMSDVRAREIYLGEDYL